MNPGFVDNLINRILRVTCSFDKDENWTRQQSKKKQQTKKLSQENYKSDLLCIRCRTPITSIANSIEMAGTHLHRFTNPDAQTFEIALYSQARVLPYGVSTAEFSWFPGYAWQVVLCSGCQIQLGWRYRKVDSPDFYGLISDNLILEK